MPTEKKTEIILTGECREVVIPAPLEGPRFVAEGSIPSMPTYSVVPTQTASISYGNYTWGPNSIGSMTSGTISLNAATALSGHLSQQYGTIVSAEYVHQNLITTQSQTGTTYTVNYAPYSYTSDHYYINTTNGIVGGMNGNVIFNGSFAIDIKERLRSELKQNLLIKFGKRQAIDSKVSAQELKARDTLRDMISEADWRRYMTNGFIMVKGSKEFSGKSAFWYQIFADRAKRVKVYQDGKAINEICIHSDTICPPTDHVINMKVLVELDEGTIWSGGNVNPVSQDWVQKPSEGTFIERAKLLKMRYAA